MLVTVGSDFIEACAVGAVCKAIGQYNGNRNTVLHILGFCQNTKASVDTRLQVRACGKAAVLTQDLAVIVISRDHTCVSCAIVIEIGNLQQDTVTVSRKRQNRFTINVIGHNSNSYIADRKKIAQQLISRSNGTLKAGNSVAVLIVH